VILKMNRKFGVAVIVALVASLLGVVSTTSIAVGSTRCGGRVPTIVGTNASERIEGTRGPDVIDGRGGDDIIYGLAGNDIICGGGGRDQVVGSAGDDLIYGDGGPDRLIGGDGDDRIIGGSGRDYIQGNNGHDVLNGQADNDEIHGGSGNDWLNGGTGNDRLVGGSGNDSINDPDDPGSTGPTTTRPSTTTTRPTTTRPSTTTSRPTTTRPTTTTTRESNNDGVPFGFWAQPSQIDTLLGEQGHSMIHLPLRRGDLVEALDKIAGYDAKVSLQLGVESQYMTNGSFNLSKWKNTIKSFRDDPATNRAIRDRIADGTIAVIYLLDEPFHEGHWGAGRLRTNREVDLLGQHVKQFWPEAKVSARYSADFFWMHEGRKANPYKFQHIDYFWHMYRHDHGPLDADEAVDPDNWVFNNGRPVRGTNPKWKVQWYGRDSGNIRLQRERRAADLQTPANRDIGIIFSLQAYNGGSGESGDKFWNNTDWRMGTDELWTYTRAAVEDGADMVLVFRWERDGDAVAEWTGPGRQHYGRTARDISDWMRLQ
jgi:hypothetical protein